MAEIPETCQSEDSPIEQTATSLKESKSHQRLSFNGFAIKLQQVDDSAPPEETKENE